MEFKLESVPIRAKRRKLKAKWTVELEQDLMHMGVLDDPQPDIKEFCRTARGITGVGTTTPQLKTCCLPRRARPSRL